MQFMPFMQLLAGPAGILDTLQQRKKSKESVQCADGAANHAHEHGTALVLL